MLRGGFEVFADDELAQTHARSWASSHLRFYSDDIADIFVAWLLTLSDEEQHDVFTKGYPARVRDFEEWAGVPQAAPPTSPSPFNLDGSVKQRF